MTRTQRIDIAWLNERYLEQTFRFVECTSEVQAGDIFIKRATDVKVWERNLSLVGRFRDNVFQEAFKSTKTAPSIVIFIMKVNFATRAYPYPLARVAFMCPFGFTVHERCSQSFVHSHPFLLF